VSGVVMYICIFVFVYRMVSPLFPEVLYWPADMCIFCMQTLR
jgi:hypothetical protein